MIDGRKNMISMPCSQVNRTVPYFKDFAKENLNKYDSKYKNVDDFLIDEIVKLSKTPIEIEDK
jgi:chromosomal replication initiation ATPase DnaA